MTLDKLLFVLDAHRRSVLDLEYIENGCVGEIPDGSKVDNTIGTYATNYLIALICFVGCLVILRQRRRQQRRRDINDHNDGATTSETVQATTMMTNNVDHNDRDRRLLSLTIGHLLPFGIGFGILAGLRHQLMDNKETQSQYEWLSRSSFLLVVWSLPGLICALSIRKNNTMMMMLVGTNYKRCCWYIILFLYLVTGLVVFALPPDNGIGIRIAAGIVVLTSLTLFLTQMNYLFTSCCGCGCGCGCGCCNSGNEMNDGEISQSSLLSTHTVVFWTFATFLMLIGVIVQIGLTPICGSPAYDDCFEDCLLPVEWNHNFVYHLIQAASTICLIVGAILLSKQSAASKLQTINQKPTPTDESV